MVHPHTLLFTGETDAVGNAIYHPHYRRKCATGVDPFRGCGKFVDRRPEGVPSRRDLGSAEGGVATAPPRPRDR